MGRNSSINDGYISDETVNTCNLEKEKQILQGERLEGIRRKESRVNGRRGENYMSVFSEEKGRNGNTGVNAVQEHCARGALNVMVQKKQTVSTT